MKLSNLTVLSFGGGQDSAALLQLYLKDFEFRRTYAPGRFLVVMSDTGDEHAHTYEYVREVEDICRKNQIEFHFIRASEGFHVPAWQGLMEAQHRSVENGRPMIVQLGTKSCTSQLKLTPIYKFLDEWINREYGYGFKAQPGRGCLKQAIKKFHKEEGKIRIIIGFAYGEESRMNSSLRVQEKTYETNPDSWLSALYREFPLVDLKMDRAACQSYLTSIRETVPYPSNCMRCPYMSKQELVWLFRTSPEKFEEWAKLEEAKLARFAAEGAEKNHGVFNKKATLRQTLEIALKEFGHWSVEQLDEYKMSHGHCVKSAAY